MAISCRLHSPMDIRPDDELNEKPKRIVFLSVEGKTETNYFKYIHHFREQLGINALVHVETLSRWSTDTCSSPNKVFDLLLECYRIKEEGIQPKDIYNVLNTSAEEFSIDCIRKYISDEIPGQDDKKLKSAIRLAGIDLDYQKFLKDFNGEAGNDLFAVVIDRDCGSSNSDETLREIIQKCHEMQWLCFLSNPCFEFWLLLHLTDVKEEYKDRLQTIKENSKVSRRHTFVSCEVSKKAHHAKEISETQFHKHYLPNIDCAIERAKDFESQDELLLENIGSNIPKLFEILRES